MLACFTKKVIEELNKMSNDNTTSSGRLNIADIENYVVKTECEQIAETFFS